MNKNFIEEYFSGKELYGNDFSPTEIEEWYRLEEEGYANLISNDTGVYTYNYHNLNKVFGYDNIKDTHHFAAALGIGSAFGEEFLPLVDENRIGEITILEPSEKLRNQFLGTVKVNYVKPLFDGRMAFEDNQFDLITCFGTLHHIPNVSFVLNEMARVLKPGGYMLIREPINTMGDWRQPRTGLTASERGIPHHFFDKEFDKLKLTVVKKTFCESLFFYKLLNKISPLKYTSNFYKFDGLISKLFAWNIHYHRTNPLQKIAPGSVFYVLKK